MICIESCLDIHVGVMILALSIVNILFYYWSFKELNLDLFPTSTFAARYSAFNPIEHVWSSISNGLAGNFEPDLFCVIHHLDLETASEGCSSKYVFYSSVQNS